MNESARGQYPASPLAIEDERNIKGPNCDALEVLVDIAVSRNAESRHSPPGLEGQKRVGFYRSLPVGLFRCTIFE